MPYSLLALCIGASTGATMRWGLGLALNHVIPSLALGTLVANLLGGYLIGLAAAFFATHPALGAQWSLLVVTGFLGSLTTFSSFSHEVVSLLQQGNMLMAGGAVAMHVCGSLLMTFLGMGTYMAVRGAV